MQQPNQDSKQKGEVYNTSDAHAIDPTFNVIADESILHAIKDYKPSLSSPIVNSTLISGSLPYDVSGHWQGRTTVDIHRSSTFKNKRVKRNNRIDRILYDQSELTAKNRSAQSFKLRRDDICVYPLDREALIYDPAIQSLHHLNETAYFVWCRLEKQSLKDLAHSLVNEFDVGIQTAIEHVSEMIRMFRIHSLLVVEPRDESHD